MTEFEKLFQENQGFIFKYLVKMTQDRSLAEELTQETFFRAYMNISSLRDKEKASVWLCQIAKNTYFTWFNQQKQTDSLDALDELGDGKCIEEAFAQKELSQKALQCLHDLEEPYKEVFSLRVFGELSFKQISLIFGKSEHWACVTYHRAKEMIRGGMSDEDFM